METGYKSSLQTEAKKYRNNEDANLLQTMSNTTTQAKISKAFTTLSNLIFLCLWKEISTMLSEEKSREKT